MLAAILAGARPARGTCPVATVAIYGDETGDQFIGSPEVKVPVGRAAMLGQIRQGANNSTGRNASKPWSSSEIPPTGSGLWEMLEVPSRLRFGEGQRRQRRNWVHAAVELPGVAEGEMLRQNGQRKHGTTSGSLGAPAQRRHRI